MPDSSLQLPASSINIKPSWPTNKTGHRPSHNFLERRHPFRKWSLKRNPRPRIQRNQIHLTVNVSQHPSHPPRVRIAIVDIPQQHIFKRQPLPTPQRISLTSSNQILQMPLARNRHQFLPLLLGRSIQRNRQFRAHLSFTHLFNLRNNSRCRYRNSPLAHTHRLRIGQNPRSLQNVWQIQQRFAHPHHHDVEPLITRQKARYPEPQTKPAPQSPRR